jgi:ATP-dependent helicase/DNAse subunit B
VPLALVAGPAHAGKVARLLDRYLDALAADPWLIVPNRSDVDRVERDLLRRQPALLAGHVGTFDDLFRHIAAHDSERRPEATDAQRLLAVRRAVARAQLNGVGSSARTAGFAETLAASLGELESAFVDMELLRDDLGNLASTYRSELERLGLWDRDLVRRRAAERLGSDLDAWHGEPVFAYGFEDLTAAEWHLLEALSARAQVTVSLPYEPGRAAFASLTRTSDDLAALAERIEELEPAADRHLPASLAHLERMLFVDDPADPPELDGSIRFFEGGGVRGTAELVGEEVLAQLRAGCPAEEIAIVCESVERWRVPLEAALGRMGIPLAVEQRLRLAQTPFGGALLAVLRYAWLGGGRAELFAFLRSPFSGIARPSVDYVEGRLRGRAVRTRERVEEESERLRSAPVPFLAALRVAATPVAGLRELVRGMAAAAHGLHAPPVGDAPASDLRCVEATMRTLAELERFETLDGGPLAADEVVSVLERITVRPGRTDASGRVAVLDVRRARTRRFDIVFLFGLEEGSLPSRRRGSPFLDDELRRRLGGRLERADPVERDRYLFYTACTRARRRLVLVREAATDDGSPRQPSPFWDEVQRVFDAEDVSRWTRRRSLSELTWPLESAPTGRERLRALAVLAVEQSADAAALASANGWTRKLERARAAFERETRLRNPAVLDWLASRTTFSATELERFADCSSAWLVERIIAPKTIDAEPDPMLRGQVAHTALFRFYAALPRELGVDRVGPEQLEPALALVRRCLDEALESGVRLELTGLQRAELRHSLLRDLEGFVRDEAATELGLVPRRLEVLFGSDRSAPELQRGLALGDGLTLSGKIDRIDVDPFSARGIVQDYKSGKGAHSARDIDRELRLQIPLYLLVLRDLAGIEPLGGVYRALSGKRLQRGMLRESARTDLPGFTKADYLGEEAFWAQVDTARERAAAYAQRIRAGDTKHDPKGDGCPSWCDLWPICRVERG